MSFTNKVYSRKPSVCRLKPAPVTSFKYNYVYQDVEDVALFRLVNPHKQQWALYNDSQEFTMSVCVYFEIKMQQKKYNYIKNNITSKIVKNGQSRTNSNEEEDNILPIRALARAQLYIEECNDRTRRTQNNAEHVKTSLKLQSECKVEELKHNNMSLMYSDHRESQTKQPCLHWEREKSKYTEPHVRSQREHQTSTASVGPTVAEPVKPLSEALITVTVKVSTSVKPHETVLFCEYDNPIDVEGAVMQIDVTLSECEVKLTEFVGGWRRSDNALVLKPEISVMPSYTNMYRCFPKHTTELLYRLVDRESNTWAFYNDTVDYKITVEMELDAESFGVAPLDHTLVRSNDSQLFDRESTPEQSLLALFSLPNEVSQEPIHATNRNLTFTSCLNGSTTTNTTSSICTTAANRVEHNNNKKIIFKNYDDKHCTTHENDNNFTEQLEMPVGQTESHFQRQPYTESLLQQEQQHYYEHHQQDHNTSRKTGNREVLATFINNSKENIYSFPPSAKPGATTANKERMFELTLLPLTTERFLQGVPVNYVISFTAEPLHNETAQYERIPFVNGAPDRSVIDYDQLYSCFNKEQHQGMLFRLVDTLNRCWGFYNDTTQYYFTVECTFPSMTLANVCEAGPETSVQLMPVDLMKQHISSEHTSVSKLSLESEHVHTITDTNSSSQVKQMHTKRFCGKESNKEGKMECTESVINTTTHESANRKAGVNTYREAQVQQAHNDITNASCAVVFTLLIPPCSTRLFLSGGLPQEYSLHFIGKLSETKENKIVASTTENDEVAVKELEEWKQISTENCYRSSEHHIEDNNNSSSVSNVEINGSSCIKKEKCLTNTLKSEIGNLPHKDKSRKHAKVKKSAQVSSFKLNGPQKSTFDYQRIVPCVVDCNDYCGYQLIDNSSGEFDQWGFYNDMSEFELIVIAKFVNKHDIFGNNLGPPIIPVNRKQVKLIKIVSTRHKSTTTSEQEHTTESNKQSCNKEIEELNLLRESHSSTDKNVCAEDSNKDTIDCQFHELNESFSAPVMPFYKSKQRPSRTSFQATPSLSPEQLLVFSPLSASPLSWETTTNWQAFTKEKIDKTQEEKGQQQVMHDTINDSTWHHTKLDEEHELYDINKFSKQNNKYDKNSNNNDRNTKNDNNRCKEIEEAEKKHNNNATCINCRHTWTAVIAVVKPGETKPFLKFKHLVPANDYELCYHTRLCASSNVKIEHSDALVRGTQQLKLRYSSIFSSAGKIADAGKGDDVGDNCNSNGDDNIQENKLFRLVYNYELDNIEEENEEEEEYQNECLQKQEKNSNVVKPSEYCRKSISTGKSGKELADNITTLPPYDNVISVQDEWKLYASHVDWALFNDSPDMCYIVRVRFNDNSEIKPLGVTHVHKVNICSISRTEAKYHSDSDKAEQRVFFSSTVLPLQTVPFLTGYIVGEYRITIRADAAPENKIINFVNGVPNLERKTANELPTSETNNSEFEIVPANNQLSNVNVNSCKLPLLKHVKKSSLQQQEQQEKQQLLECTEEGKKKEERNILSQQSLRIYRVFSKSENGLLFRIVDDARQCWWFYNDTKHVTFKVNVTFYANSSFQVAGNAVLVTQPEKCKNNFYHSSCGNVMKDKNKNSFRIETNDVNVNGNASVALTVKANDRHHLRLPHVNVEQENEQETIVCNKKEHMHSKHNRSIIEVVVRPLTTELFITHADIIRFQLAANVVTT